MNQESETQPDAGRLIEDADALLSATSRAVEEKTQDARQRLAVAFESARKTLGVVQEKAVCGAKATDKVIREHPYQAIGVAIGVGALIGYLLGRRSN